MVGAFLRYISRRDGLQTIFRTTTNGFLSERIGTASFMHAVSLHYAIFEMKVDMQICLAIYNILLRQC